MAVPATAHAAAGPIQAPDLTSVQASGTTVTVTWTDGSTNEKGFSVLRGPANAQPLSAGNVTSTTSASTGTTYTFVDTIPAGVRICYQITASDTAGDTSPPSGTVCTPLPHPQPVGPPLA
jgi:hypothetical protein